MLKAPECSYQGLPDNNDQWVHRIVFPHKHQGCFVEVGAATGVWSSSCNFLEQLGWRGYCIEPCSRFYKQLIVNRPKAICENICISNIDGEVLFHDDEYLSHVVENDGRPLKSMTLDSFLQKHKISCIDYLSVAGIRGDKFILQDFPFHNYTVLCISTEGDAAEPVLLKNGFIKSHNPFNVASWWERYYIHESVATAHLRFLI